LFPKGFQKERRNKMNALRALSLVAIAAFCVTVSAPKIQAQQVEVEVAAAPDCPYGYYDYAPYACAPYGYYGPEWFVSGVFVGAGPWFHGPKEFHGHVDTHFDVKQGYKGPTPNRGDKVEENRHPEKVTNFKGNEIRDGRGHVVEEKR
jgi:hypothetical protein